MHRTTIVGHLKRRGVCTRYKVIAEADLIEAASLYAEGWSLARVGERFDVSARHRDEHFPGCWDSLRGRLGESVVDKVVRWLLSLGSLDRYGDQGIRDLSGVRLRCGGTPRREWSLVMGHWVRRAR